MRQLPDLLFYRQNLSSVLHENLQRAIKVVNGIPEQQFIEADDTEIIEHIYSRTEIIPIQLHEDAREMDTQDTQIDVSHDPRRHILDRNGPFYVPGISITVSIPFAGDPKLWNCQPNAFNTNPPRANIRSGFKEECQGFVDIVMEEPLDMANDASQFKGEANNILSNIKWYLQQVNGQVLGHNQELKEKIKGAISNRRQRLGKRAEIAEAMNIPLKRKAGSPDVTQLPIKCRIIKPLQTKKGTRPEPTISNEEYENILKIIRHVGQTFETTPRTYAVHDEDELRDIMLANLNGHYEGRATGETFRKSGKTDIRIEDNNRAAFVGECKFWRGPKELPNAVDQLLGYLTWRDCKAALIIFNKDIAGFSAIQKKVLEIIKQHPNYLQQLETDQPGEWRFRAKSTDDPERLITVHVFLFNIYVNSKHQKGGA